MASPKQDDNRGGKSVKKRRHDGNSKESYATKPDSCGFPTSKDGYQSTRQIKKPVYRLEKTKTTDQKSVNKEEKRTKTKNISVPFHEENYSCKAKNDISGKHYAVSGSKMVERGSSEPSDTKKQLSSSSLVPSRQKEEAHNVLKRKCRAEEPPWSGKDSNTVKVKEPRKSSSASKDSARQKRKEPVKDMCHRHQENKSKSTGSVCTKTPSASTTHQSSTSAKNTTSVSTSQAVKNVTSIPENVKHQTAKSSSAQQQRRSIESPLPFKFKIPKMVQPRPVDSTTEAHHSTPTNRNLKHGTELSNSQAAVSNSKQAAVQQAASWLDVPPSFPSEGRDKKLSLSGQLSPSSEQMQVVKELHRARSEKRLEVNVMQSYGELTCMDIDPPAEGAADTPSKQPLQPDVILVLDTNILLSHLDFVKKVQSHGLGVLGFPVVLIPWVVLQELDSLKSGRGLSGSVAHLASPAISYINNCLKSRASHLWGQSMQQAAESSNNLNAENNDDRVLLCCLQFRGLYPECTLILCTNDKNLCNKALLSGVEALSKNDLEAKLRKSQPGFPPLQTETSTVPHRHSPVSSLTPSTSHTTVQPRSQERRRLSAGLLEKDDKRLSKREDKEKTKLLSECVSELEDCLREVLSDVLEVEMKAAYEDLWLEIVYLKPPWTLQDVLQCMKKHWIAVFGYVVQRRLQETVLNLINFFNSGTTVDCSSTVMTLQEGKELVKAFRKSSSRVPSAISVIDNILNKLQSKEKSPATPACDVVMKDDEDEDKQSVSTQVSHQEVWSLLDNFVCKVWQTCCEVFQALGFDPESVQSAQSVGSLPPPQDALVCLHNLSTMVSQLLQAFSSVLSSAPGLEDVQTLFSIVYSNEIVNMDSKLTAEDILDCFSQEHYREKLRVGGNQLMELKGALDRCVGVAGQHMTFPT